MALTAHASGTLATVVSLTVEQVVSTVAVDGVFQFVIDLSALATGDVAEVEIRQRVLTAGVSRIVLWQQFAGAQTFDPIKMSVPLTNNLAEANAVEFVIHQTHGAARSVPWKVLRHA